MSSLRDSYVAYSAAKNAPSIYWGLTFGAIVHPKSRKTGIKMASFGGRVSLGLLRASASVIMNTPLSAGGVTTLRTSAVAASGVIALYGSAVTAGYALGAVVGTGVSHSLFGKSGARDALEFYSGKVSAKEYFVVVGDALGTL